MSKPLNFFACLALCLCIGCSEQTQQETSEALEETGEAVGAAVEDAAENTEAAAREVGDAVDANDSDPDATDP